MTKQEFQKKKEKIDKLLEDKKFQALVQSDIGIVPRVKVDWDKNEILFEGSEGKKILKIDETLAVLDNQIH